MAFITNNSVLSSCKHLSLFLLTISWVLAITKAPFKSECSSGRTRSWSLLKSSSVCKPTRTRLSKSAYCLSSFCRWFSTRLTTANFSQCESMVNAYKYSSLRGALQIYFPITGFSWQTSPKQNSAKLPKSLLGFCFNSLSLKSSWYSWNKRRY